ncbi:MAG: hypothetical protein IJS09_09925 [Treponema sp.]|nr:hypothetical protein [Treponema sp.]
MKRKVGIIGAGHVGTHVASALALRGIADEIVLLDSAPGKAYGMKLDLEDGTAYYPHNVIVKAGEYADFSDADILVNAASGPIQKDDRTKELKASMCVAQDIAQKIKASGFSGILISISNPCDVIAQYLAQETGLNVLGTGTALDGARVKVELAKSLHVDPHSIQGYSFGEHGNSQFVPLSVVTVCGIPFADYVRQKNIAFDAEGFLQWIKVKAWKIFDAKPCTEFGIGNACAEIIQAIFTDSRTVLPVSAMMNGEYGVRGMYLSVPRVIGRNGVVETAEFPVSEEERALLHKSGETVLANYTRGRELLS